MPLFLICSSVRNDGQKSASELLWTKNGRDLRRDRGEGLFRRSSPDLLTGDPIFLSGLNLTYRGTPPFPGGMSRGVKSAGYAPVLLGVRSANMLSSQR